MKDNPLKPFKEYTHEELRENITYLEKLTRNLRELSSLIPLEILRNEFSLESLRIEVNRRRSRDLWNRYE